MGHGAVFQLQFTVSAQLVSNFVGMNVYDVDVIVSTALPEERRAAYVTAVSSHRKPHHGVGCRLYHELPLAVRAAAV